MTRHSILVILAAAWALLVAPLHAQEPPPAETAEPAQSKPNILVIWGDDIGTWNISHNNRGMMGYETPNIDRIADGGISFTDYYAQQSCTAGRAAFMGGTVPLRTGMTKVGLPGAAEGWQEQDITIAAVLKEQGYATGQFGKNHLGDRNEHLPTMHGFDEFFGNLYHLNTSEEPEQVDYPDDPEFVAKYGVRGVVRSTATDTDDPTEDPRFGRVGTQIIEDTGPLTRERMETVDQEFQAAAIDFMRRSQEAGDPFFVWLNPSRMHLYTHLTDESRYLAAPFTTEHDLYGSGMIEHDRQVGDLLAAMADLGVLDDTIVVYSTDNGPEHSARLHGGMTPFRGEKMTTYEGGVRVPMLVRWPGHIPAGTIRNGIQAHMDIFTTLAAAGVPDVATQMLEEQDQVLDGVDNLAYWTGASDDSARDNFLYYYESDIKAIRIGPWKVHFATSENYYDVYTAQKFPVFFNVRMDPFESYDEVGDRSGIVQRKQWLNEPIQEILGAHIQSLVEHPPVQEATSFDFSELMRQMRAGAQ